MKNDLICRQAAIEVLLTAAHINLSDGQAYFLEKALNEIPSAQPEQWIPVTERLPEEEVQVLVTDDAGGLATIDVDCGYFDEEYGRFEWFHSQNVTAWMPLPEPWRGEEDG